MSDSFLANFDYGWNKIFQILTQNTSTQPTPKPAPQQDIEVYTLPPQTQPIIDNNVIWPAQQQFILPANNLPPETAPSFKPNEPTEEEINQTLARYKKYLPKNPNSRFKYRAYNPYMVYRLENIKKYKNKGMSADEITKSISDNWKNLSSKDKEPYWVISRNLQICLNRQKAKGAQKQNKRKRVDSDKEDIKECPVLCGENTEEMSVGVLEPSDLT